MSWWFDERANVGRENLDVAHVEAYDAKEDADAEREVAVLVDHGLVADSVVVEFGAGTGQFTMAVAPAVSRVIAVDPSAPMRDRLGAKLGAAGIENVDVVDAGFLTYEHVGGPVDAVYSRYALHHLPDFWKAVALDRMRSLLRPGGIARIVDVLYDFPLADTAEELEAWSATGRDVAPMTPVSDGWGRWEIEEHIRDEHSTFTWLFEAMVERARFEVRDRSVDSAAHTAAYVLAATS